MATKREVKRLLLAKIETTYGTDPVPTGAANAVIAHWSNFPEPANSDYVDRQILKPWFGRSQQFTANSKVNLAFDVEVAGNGAAGSAPPWGPLARMCGFAETLNAGVSAVYNPISASEESATLYYNLDDVQQKMLGCRGSLGLTFAAGQVPYINLTAQGLYAAPTDTALPSPTFTPWQTPLIVNKVNTPTFTLHGFAAVLKSLTLDMKKDLVSRDWVNLKKIDFGDQAPTGSVTIELPSISAKDYFTAMQNSAMAALQLIHGTVAGNIVQIDAPNVQVTNPKFATEKGVALLTMDLSLVPSAGNDELTITVK